MEILEPHDQYGWITAVVQGRWVCAKVYNEPSIYGIESAKYPDGGRVSKLSIGKTDSRDPNAEFFKQMAFNYDRGLDFKKISQSLLMKIVDELESLPLLDLS